VRSGQLLQGVLRRKVILIVFLLDIYGDHCFAEYFRLSQDTLIAFRKAAVIYRHFLAVINAKSRNKRQLHFQGCAIA